MESLLSIKYKVILVPFPFDNFSTTKVRPALCLTQPIGKYNHIVIAFISSKVPEILLPSDIIINKNDKSFKKTGLRVNSVIRIHKIVSIPKELIKRELGQLDKNFQNKVKYSISKLFDS